MTFVFTEKHVLTHYVSYSSKICVSTFPKTNVSDSGPRTFVLSPAQNNATWDAFIGGCILNQPCQNKHFNGTMWTRSFYHNTGSCEGSDRKCSVTSRILLTLESVRLTLSRSIMTGIPINWDIHFGLTSDFLSLSQSLISAEPKE